MTPREIVKRTLLFNHPARLPRQMWTLPWAVERYPEVLARIRKRHPDDFAVAPDVYRPSSKRNGNPYVVGEFIDEWGCRFQNVQEGVMGEVTHPLAPTLEEWDQVVLPPWEMLPHKVGEARQKVNQSCRNSKAFVLPPVIQRPWERYQFLRGSENALMDTIDPVSLQNRLKPIHAFYLKELEFWVTTDVDGIFFMDDWGSQNALLVSPLLWRRVFKPLYRDYCELAHDYGKQVFMHSDGYIIDILEDLIEIGVNAINAQIFCMGVEELGRRFGGRITFWGEIDRQKIMPTGNLDLARKAVNRIADALYSPAGGLIAQFEFGPGVNPAVPEVIFEEWEYQDKKRWNAFQLKDT